MTRRESFLGGVWGVWSECACSAGWTCNTRKNPRGDSRFSRFLFEANNTSTPSSVAAGCARVYENNRRRRRVEFEASRQVRIESVNQFCVPRVLPGQAELFWIFASSFDTKKIHTSYKAAPNKIILCAHTFFTLAEFFVYFRPPPLVSPPSPSWSWQPTTFAPPCTPATWRRNTRPGRRVPPRQSPTSPNHRVIDHTTRVTHAPP